MCFNRLPQQLFCIASWQYAVLDQLAKCELGQRKACDSCSSNVRLFDWIGIGN